MHVRLIVPRRPDGGHRDRLWAFCRAYWARELGVEIVEGEHLDGPFNRSAAINVGAVGEWDVAVIVDGDVIVDVDRIQVGVRRAAASGQMVLPFSRRMFVNPWGTRQILDGYVGSWEQWSTPDRDKAHCSSCVIVPRGLWDRVRGFDGRFVGWGAEDNAFHAACKSLAGVERTAGDVWHLHHRSSPHRDERSPLYRQARALWHRYRDVTSSRQAMQRLLGEPRTDDQIVVVVLTNGARDTLGKTIQSFDEAVRGPIGRKVIVADNCRPSCYGWDTVTVNGGGYTAAVIKAIDVAVGSGQPWIFWSEDDFVYEHPIDLRLLQAAMAAEPRLAQMSLLRQAWYPDEIDAGGLIEARRARGDRFVQRDRWVEHAAYWTMNPMLTTRSFLAEHPWPKGPGSENRMGVNVFRGECEPIGGIWGRLDDPPLVTHIGVKRAGRGY